MRVGLRLLILPVAALAIGSSTAAPVAASPSSPGTSEHVNPGTYSVCVNWNGGGWATWIATINRNHTGSSNTGDTLTWAYVRSTNTFTMNINNGVAKYTGKKTAPGYSSLAHPGTMSNNIGGSGIWFALISGSCPA